MPSTDNSTTWLVLGAIALVVAYSIGKTDGKSTAHQDALNDLQLKCQAHGEYLICPQELTWK